MHAQRTPQFKNIAVLSHPQIEQAGIEAQKVSAELARLGYEVIQGDLNDEDLRRKVVEEPFDLVIALGGDGTVLRAGHLCAPHNIPILPINLGSLGFLIELSPSDWPWALERLQAGEYWIERRMMLQTQIWRGDDLLGEFDVLNDTVIARSMSLRPVLLRATLDGRAVTTYVADALVVSTPTGSTAYALAAGGPILPPELRNILLVPVAPHLSIDRAIVLAEGSTVSITVMSDHGCIVSGDGQAATELEVGDRVDVCASQHVTRLLRFHEVDYFYTNLVTLMDQNPSAGETP